MSLTLPKPIAGFIGRATLTPDEIGESPCAVYRFTRGNDTFFLKHSAAIFAPTTYSVLREASVLAWLDGRLNVPELAVVAQSGDGEFMITRSVPGEPLSARLGDRHAAIALLSEALRQVQAVPASDCPFEAGAAFRLRELDYLLAHGLCAEEYDLGQWPGIATPQDLRAHLHATLPDEERVFSHGDLGDSNVFVDARDALHFVDLGRGGLADRWMDITFVHRNIREDIAVDATGDFLASLGEPDHPRKRTFFEQLDELF